MGKIRVIFKAIINRLTFNEKITAVIRYHAVRHFPKTQRNEPCPCGRGQKYKNCCQKAKRNPWKRARRVNIN